MGGRQTQSFKLVWDSFERTENALSVIDLVEEHKQTMNKTTVYRILNRLETEGKLHTFLGKNGLKWYAKCQGCNHGQHQDVHPHFQCNLCGSMECLSVTVAVPKISNHHIEQANMLLLGQCDKCVA